jgi:hypothetical protein
MSAANGSFEMRADGCLMARDTFFLTGMNNWH